MRAAHELIQGCHEPTQTAAQRAASLNTQGMIEMALGDYASAARHLERRPRPLPKASATP